MNTEAISHDDVVRVISAYHTDTLENLSGDYETGRARNSLSAFTLQGLNRNMVLKISSSFENGFSWQRKAELLVKGLFKNYAKTAFEGSLALVDAGVPTPIPLAWWSEGDFIKKTFFFLYEEVEAEDTLSKKLQKLWTEKRDASEDEAAFFISEMAMITRKMHLAGLRHGDIVTHNFLVVVKEPKLCLIDTDHVKSGFALLPKSIKQFFDFRCLRRLDFSPRGQRFFLRHYLGHSPGHIDWFVFRFWRNGGFKPTRWVKFLKKKSQQPTATTHDGLPWWYPR